MAAYAKDSPPSARHRAEREIRASREGGPLISWLIALIVLGAGSAFVFVAWGELMKGKEPLLWLMLIFPFLGLIMVVQALVATARFLRYGRPVLRLDSAPCLLGGEIRGTVEFRARRLPSFQSAELELQERHLERVRTTKGSRSQYRAVWSLRVPVELRQGGNSVPLALPIPSDGSQTDSDSFESVSWRVRLRAETEGADLNVVFELPVLAGPGGDPGQTKATIEEAAARDVADEGESAMIERLRREGVALLRHPAGLELCVRPLGLRRVGFAIMSLIMLALPVGYWLVALRNQQSLGRWVGFGVFAALAALVFIPTMTKSYRLLAGTRGLRIVRRILGLRSVWQVPYEAIESIQPHSSMSTSDANGTVHYYDLKILWRAGEASRNVHLGLGITDKALAQALAQSLAKPERE